MREFICIYIAIAKYTGRNGLLEMVILKASGNDLRFHVEVVEI